MAVNNWPRQHSSGCSEQQHRALLHKHRKRCPLHVRRHRVCGTRHRVPTLRRGQQGFRARERPDVAETQPQLAHAARRARRPDVRRGERLGACQPGERRCWATVLPPMRAGSCGGRSERPQGRGVHDLRLLCARRSQRHRHHDL